MDALSDLNGPPPRLLESFQVYRKAGGHKEWVTEVHFLSRVDNPFLVKLVGYCAEDDEGGSQRLLVYEYMINKGLDDHIFRIVPPVLPWLVRVKIALGAARGLAYLHHEKGAANVLLDEEFNPKLSDFGLAREGPDEGETHVNTAVKGTYGYAAPEYIRTGHLTFKCDVFSFGVVLLEIVTGRKAMDRNRPPQEQRLLEWVKPFINDPRKFHHAVDSRLETRYSLKAAMKLTTIAITCLVKQPEARPKMVDVVEGLEKVLEITYRDVRETPSIISSPSIPARTTDSTRRAAAARQSTDVTKSPRHTSLRRGSAFENSNPPAFPLPSLASRRAIAPPGLMHVEEPPETSSTPLGYAVSSGILPFHANQCGILKEQLSLAKEILNEGRSPSDLPWPKLALTELRRVSKLGETLINDCQYTKRCLKAYLRQGERVQAFAETLEEISWCKSVVKFYQDNGGQVSSTAMDEFPQLGLGDMEQYLLQKAADDDQRELQALLDSWIAEHACSAEECGRPLSENQTDNCGVCIAAQISARVSNSEGDIEGDHTSVLWKTSQGALEDVRMIGKGSYGTVIETTWLGDKFAKKEFDTFPTEFEDEANALAKLNHPHIVKVSGYGVDYHVCFFIMDIMPGDLRTYMSKRMGQPRIDQPFLLSAAMDLMLQISEAMSYINSKKMVHRDLKSMNILVKPVEDAALCKAGFVTAKLADFGLAKVKHFITSHSHLTRENLSTTFWRAPEMFRIATPVTDKAYPWQADVYSFGIVCFEILTGKPPFQPVKPTELYGLLTDPVKPLRPQLPENCPERLASLIRECWQTNPALRPTFQEVSRRLRNIKAIYMLTASEL